MPHRRSFRARVRYRTGVVLALAATAWTLAPGSVASTPVQDGPDDASAAASAAAHAALDPRVRSGAEAFLAHGCAACHRLDSVGATGLFGPVLNAAGAIAAARVAAPDYRGAATDAEGYLRESIVDPVAYLVPGYAGSYHRMPAYAHLSDEELTSLVALLTWTAPEGRPDAR